ncbi:MAG: ABC transporter ATP-binding protein [Spirulina sp. SIO3F2]|nr:ABC transporter ATP-binding protein [Spirulina sp. SIO3F2]
MPSLVSPTPTFSTHTASTAWDVELQQIHKSFAGETVINGVDLQIRPGEFFCILGPSGCGKTTLLRLIAGFEFPTTGQVLIQNQTMNAVPPYKRPVNTVFQSYALFNHLTVAENIAFGLKLKRLSKSEIEQKVITALAGVRLDAFAQRYPQQLSGGQRQRVALARALVNRPAVVLLDEPLGALDLKLRKEMQVELSRLHQEVGLTFVMVTHDQEEALSLSDRIAVVRAGYIEQVGTPTEIYEHPKTAFVADFIGETNLFEGVVQVEESARLQVNIAEGFGLWSQTIPDAPPVVTLSIRPEKVQLTSKPTTQDNCFQGRIQHLMYLGTHVQFVVALEAKGDESAPQQTMTVRQPNPMGLTLEPNTSVYVSWSAEDCLTFAK